METIKYRNHSITLWTDRYGQIQISVNGVRSFGASGNSALEWRMAREKARQIVDAKETK